MFKIDFHVHSSISRDSYLPPKLLPTLMKKLGYHACGIVDHNSNKGALIARKYAPKNFLVLVGQEIKTPQGEIIVFGSEKIFNGSIWEIIDEAKEENFLTVLPHPLDFTRKSSICRNIPKTKLLEIFRKVDAIEVFNARCLFSIYNSRAKLLAKIMKKPMVAGSDAHTLSELGKTKTFIRARQLDRDDIFEAVRKGKTKIQGNLSSWIVHAKSAFARLEKILDKKCKNYRNKNSKYGCASY